MARCPYFEFCCPVTIVSGHAALEQIPGLLGVRGSRRPLVITDAGVTAAGLVKILTEAVGAELSIGAVDDDVPPDSDLATVRRLAALYRETDCDGILAIGGGSVLDTAKGVNILVSEGGQDLMRFSGAGTIRHPLGPLVAVPTTAGTGSEVTLVAVIADHDRQVKMPFTSTFLLPDAAVLDPRMTLTLPPHLTAATAMDALTHAVEAYTCLAKNPLSDAYAVAAIERISRHLLPVMNRPDDADGRLALAEAATLAGIAFSNSMVGMVHALGHSLGGLCRVPHGTCMALLLPYGLEYNRKINGHLTAELLLPLAGEDVFARTPAHRRSQAAIAGIRTLNDALHRATGGRHARCLGEIRDPEGRPMVPADILPAVARLAVNDGAIFYNPVEMDTDDALRVLQAAWTGEPLETLG